MADQQAKFYPRCRVCNKSFSGYEDFWVYKCEKCRYYAHHHCAYSRSSYLRSKPSESALNLRLPSKKQVSLSNRLDARKAPPPITIEELEDDYDVLRLPLSEQNYNKVKDFFLKETNYERSITHSSHEHPLILVDAQCNDITAMTTEDSLCNACLVSIIENMRFYKCKFTDQGCNFVLHDWCTRLPAELHDYVGHPQHTLLLLTKAGREFSRFKCDACLRQCNGFAYSCVQCNYNIQVRCAFIPKRITHKSHPGHLLSRFVEGTLPEDYYCRMCLSDFKDNTKISFSCDACEFHLHIGCALLLPETIRHRYDKHPLSLAYSPIENHVDDYFCEVCEEELNPNACFYHCHECVQSIHTACAPILIPQSKPYIHGALKVRYRNLKFGGIHKTEYHPHPLSFLYGTTSDGDCTKCDETLTGCHILKCLECKFAIHYICETPSGDCRHVITYPERDRNRWLLW